jgi:hypothetical protein
LSTTGSFPALGSNESETLIESEIMDSEQAGGDPPFVDSGELTHTPLASETTTTHPSAGTSMASDQSGADRRSD